MSFPSGWHRKSKIVNNETLVSGSLSNYPLLLTHRNLPYEMFESGGIYSARSDGGDLRVSADANGTIQLPLEVEHFYIDSDPANGKASVWVNLPTISSTSSIELYIWYNNPTASGLESDDVYGSQNVWDSNFQGVWHLSGSNDNLSVWSESTSNGYDGILYNRSNAHEMNVGYGPTHAALATNAYLEMGDVLDVGTNDWTVSGVFLQTAIDIDTTAGIVNKRRNIAGGDGYTVQLTGTGSHFSTAFGASAGSTYGVKSDSKTFEIIDGYGGDITYFAYRIDRSSIHDLIVNGVIEPHTSSIISEIGYNVNDTVPLRIGSVAGIGTGVDTTRIFLGWIDEVRISNIVRQADWSYTEWKNITSASLFTSASEPVTGTFVGLFNSGSDPIGGWLDGQPTLSFSFVTGSFTGSYPIAQDLTFTHSLNPTASFVFVTGSFTGSYPITWSEIIQRSESQFVVLPAPLLIEQSTFYSSVEYAIRAKFVTRKFEAPWYFNGTDWIFLGTWFDDIPSWKGISSYQTFWKEFDDNKLYLQLSRNNEDNNGTLSVDDTRSYLLVKNITGSAWVTNPISDTSLHGISSSLDLVFSNGLYLSRDDNTGSRALMSYYAFVRNQDDRSMIIGRVFETSTDTFGTANILMDTVVSTSLSTNEYIAGNGGFIQDGAGNYVVGFTSYENSSLADDVHVFKKFNATSSSIGATAIESTIVVDNDEVFKGAHVGWACNNLTAATNGRQGVGLYTTRNRGGEVRYAIWDMDDGTIVDVGTDLFPGILYDDSPGSSSFYTAGTMTTVYDEGSDFIHVVMKNSGSGDIWYNKINCLDGNAGIPQQIFTFGSIGLEYGVHMALQDDIIKLAVHKGGDNVIDVYHKGFELDSFTLAQSISSSGLDSYGAAILLMEHGNTGEQAIRTTPVIPVVGPNSLGAAGRGGTFRQGDDEPSGIEFPVELVEVIDDIDIIKTIGIDYRLFIQDLNEYFNDHNINAQAAKFVTNKYIENVKKGRDKKFGNRVVMFNREMLQLSLETLFVDNFENFCLACRSDVLNEGLLGFWAGAQFSGEHLPFGANRMIQNYVIPGETQVFAFETITNKSIFISELVGFFKRNLDTMSGLLTIEVGSGNVQTFTWRGFG